MSSESVKQCKDRMTKAFLHEYNIEKKNPQFKRIMDEIAIHFKVNSWGLDYNVYLGMSRVNCFVFNTFLTQKGYKVKLQNYNMLIVKPRSK